MDAPVMRDAKLLAAMVRWVNDETQHGLFATDTQFRIVVWNRWMEVHTGHTAADALGQSLFDLYPDARERGMHEYFESALIGHVTMVSQGLHRYMLSMPPTQPDLPYAQMPQSGQIGPLSDASGIIGVAAVIEDVSERLASEAELRRQIEAQQQARATAEKALRAKDEFLSTLSHEIRTPLNAVLGWSRILLGREKIEPELLDRAMHVIERNAAAQARMIDDMLDMARIVAGKLRLEMQPVDLVSVTLAACDVVQPSATAKRITVQTALDPMAPRVLGDQDRLQQVLWNLLSNAVRFTEEGGRIEVRLEGDASRARLLVTDTGQGIAPDFLPFIFERFRQSDASSARRHGGLGLGLALVRELVELHGGTVAADSQGEGRGATFIITIPAITSDVHGVRGDAGAVAIAPSLQGVRVLVVEDETDARELSASALEYGGAEVVTAPSVAEAIAALQAGPLPHVIVSDIGMPREDGYEFIRRLRAMDAEHGGLIPALAVTGYASLDDAQRALGAGYQAHMSKPINPSELIAVVGKLAKR